MSKRSTPLATVSAEHMWQLHVKQHLLKNPTHIAKYLRNTPNGQLLDETGKVVLTYTEFKRILVAINKKAVEKIIKGFTFDLGMYLGDLFAARVERGKGNKALNKAESMKLHAKLKAEGKLTSENWKVYYTDDDFCMIMWHRGNGRLPNIRLYKFKTAGGQPGKGFRQLFSNTVKNKPHLKAIYPFIPATTLDYQ